MHKSTISSLVLIAASYGAGAEDRLTVGDFSSRRLAGWEPESFDGETDYRFVKIDGPSALRAPCNDSASGLIFQREIDLNKTPILHWSWRIDSVYPGLNEKTKSGDDYPARIYVIYDGGWLKWRSRAIDYVWSSSQPVGGTWPNAFVSQAMMFVVQSGPPAQSRRWCDESRNVREDFKRSFGLEFENVDAVALMTDCDNSGLKSTAYYGDIYFTPAAPDKGQHSDPTLSARSPCI